MHYQVHVLSCSHYVFATCVVFQNVTGIAWNRNCAVPIGNMPHVMYSCNVHVVAFTIRLVAVTTWLVTCCTLPLRLEKENCHVVVIVLSDFVHCIVSWSGRGAAFVSCCAKAGRLH